MGRVFQLEDARSLSSPSRTEEDLREVQAYGDRLRAAIAATGVTAEQLGVLRRLSASAAVTWESLAAGSELAAAALSDAAEAVVAQGWAEVSPAGGASAMFAITDRGRRALAAASARLRRAR